MFPLDTRVAALREGSGPLFPEVLPEAYGAHLETVPDRVRERSGRDGSLEPETAVRDAGDRLSAGIPGTAFLPSAARIPGPFTGAGDTAARTVRRSG